MHSVENHYTRGSKTVKTEHLIPHHQPISPLAEQARVTVFLQFDFQDNSCQFQWFDSWHS